MLQKDRTDEEIQANKELYWRLALIRLNLGACRAVTGQLGEVEPLLTYAITAFVNIKNYTLLTVAYRGAGQYYSFMQQWQKSEYYFFAALDLARTKTQFPRHVAQILISLCELFVAQQLPSRAAQYCHEARTISEEHKYQDLIARQRLCALKVDLLAGDVESVNTVNRLCDVLKAALAYNSYVLDELLADIIQYFSQQVGNGPELLEQLLAFWKNSHQNGRPLAEIDYASRVSDSLDNQVTPTVAEQLERFFDLQS